MTVVFPPDIVPTQMDEPEPVVTGGVLRSELTGAAQIRASARMRWRASFTLPPLQPDEARRVRAALTQARRDTLAIQLSPNAVGGPGAVSGVSCKFIWSGGFLLVMQGLPSSLTLRQGWFVSILTGGRHYLYQIAEDALGGFADRTITMTSVPHAIHAVNDPVSFVPTLEGVASWGGGTIDAVLSSGAVFTVEQL